MAHGDDNGLVLPPQLAPTQAVVIAVRDEADVNEACARVARDLTATGVRVVIDRGRGSSGDGSPIGRSRGCRCALRLDPGTSPRAW